MKKILYFIILFLLLVTKINVKASEVTLVKERIGDLYTYYYDENLDRYRYLYLNKYLFGDNYAYCIELGKNIDGNIYSYSTSFNNTNISDNDLEYIKLVSYYGYDYPGHKTDRYYMAAQELIWLRLSKINVKWIVNLNPKDSVEVSEEKEEILELVSKHYKKPSFDNTTINIVKGETLTINDNNNVIANYKLNTKYAKIEGTSLIIDGNINTNKIELTKNESTNKVFMLYTNGTSQKMMSTGKVEQIKSNININIIDGKITIHKKDKETNSSPQGEATLSGAKYNLYDDSGNIKGTFITGKKETIDNLPIGQYYIKEIEPSKGYKLDSNTYNVNITKDNLDIEVTVYEEVIKRKVEMFKVFSSTYTGLLTPEEKIEFEVCDKNNNIIKTLTTDKDGYMSTVLPYGTYTLRQVTTTEGYEKIKDYQIKIDEYDERPIYKIFTDSEIKAKVKIIKKDLDTKEIITNSDARFKIYDVKNNKYISFKITYPEEKIIDIFELTNGIFITPEELPSGTYRLFEIDEKIDGYLYNDEGVEFKISESSDFIDNNNEKIIEVPFYNKKVVGKIEVYKYGEDIIYQNDSYKYKETLLNNVVFNLYAKENIYQNNKLIYNKDELIEELITDNNGYSMVDNLPLGEYYIKEISSSNDNNVSNIAYNITLAYKDQYTEKVLCDVDIYNYIKKGKLIINKLDKNTNNPIPNTLIEIRNQENTVIYKGYTDNNGQIILEDLKYGEYYLAETEASTGYKLLEEKIPFTIDKEETTINVYNERIPVPNTSINPQVYIMLSIISIMLGLLIILLIPNKLIRLFLVIIIIISCFIIVINRFQIYINNTKNTKAVEAYFTNKIDNTYEERYKYNAVLEIPSINLKRGILEINNKYNNADYNIELVKEEDVIVLAAHNGNYYNSYFGNLSRLQLGDTINYYKDGKTYQYIYSDSYEIKKDGYADLYYKKDKKSIILITCKDNSDDAQIVHIGYLKEIKE